MAFGIPGSESSGNGNGPFLDRIQYDARVGFWTIVRRVQNAEGWSTETSEPFQKPTFLVDFGTLEVGYLKLTSPPAFVLVPINSTIPPQPQEMMTDSNGKQRKAFMPGFRVQLCGKLFGDNKAYYFNSNAKTVIGPVEELYNLFLSSPEAATGKIPAVSCPKTKVIEISSPKGTQKYHAPVFDIIGWSERPACFGERTVPAPGIAAKPSSPPPSNHVPPPPAHVTAPVPDNASPADAMPTW